MENDAKKRTVTHYQKSETLQTNIYQNQYADRNRRNAIFGALSCLF